MYPFDGGLNGDGFGEDEQSGFNGPDYGQREPFIKDHLYYHSEVDIEIITETEKAYLEHSD